MRTLQLAVLFACSSPVAAQSININISPILTPTYPAEAYGGAAGQAGPWSSAIGEGVSTSYTLVDLHHGLLDHTATQTAGSPAGAAFDHPATTGDDGVLLDDGAAFGPQGATMTWDIGQLGEGAYQIYTYAWDPATPANQTLVEVTGALEGPQAVGGSWTGAHALGVTYARHTLEVPASGTVHVRCTALGTRGFVNGFQLVRTETATAFCFGDGSLAPCPCGNNSTPGYGRGCATSNGGSMHLAVYGRSSPSDTIVLVSNPEIGTLAYGLRVFVQGTATVAPTPFGDGLSCAGGTLVRLFARTPFNAHMVSVPAAGDLSISAQSAALGDTITPGSSRVYMVYSRDAAPDFCPAPAGSTFNLSNAYRIGW